MAVATPQIEGADILEQKVESPFVMVVRRFLRHRLAMISLFILLMIVVVSLAAPWIAPYDPVRDQDLTRRNQAPSADHIMGTDALGRDVFSRLIYAGRISLGIAFAVVLLGDGLGLILGTISGYFGGWVDGLIMRIVDFMLTLPLLPILLILMTVLPPTIPLLIVVLVFTTWTGSARLIRGQILSLREREFVEASRALAASKSRIMFRHLLPNAIAPVIVNMTLGLSAIIITESALSWLGFGVQLPRASWGNMLRQVDLTVLDRQPWLAFFPGFAIFLTSLCFNFIGDGLRDALDPRQKL
jgi:peptide/nickel transport system permease protein